MVDYQHSALPALSTISRPSPSTHPPPSVNMVDYGARQADRPRLAFSKRARYSRRDAGTHCGHVPETAASPGQQYSPSLGEWENRSISKVTSGEDFGYERLRSGYVQLLRSRRQADR